MSAASDNQIRLERSIMEAPEVRRSVEEPAQALYEASDPDGVPWNKRDLAIREPWLQVARRQIAQSETDSRDAGRAAAKSGSPNPSPNPATRASAPFG